LAGFSGYLAADEVYDGPFCVLFIVDNRTFRRLAYRVLDTNPTKEDVLAFFKDFQGVLHARGLCVKGVTTDGSPLYPDAIATVFPGAKHQVCEFHVLKEILSAVLQALAKVRKALAREIPQLPRGRPSQATRRLARRAERLRARIAALFEHRHLFVQRELTVSEQQTLHHITRGRPELRTLRALIEEVYRLFDRRCRTHTALQKLARLRRRAWRFKQLRRALRKLWSPNLDKALTFLDDRLLPATSNAVERANRRHRKMQKAIYRVRTKAHVAARIAMDMLREARGCRRVGALRVLHASRAVSLSRATPHAAWRSVLPLPPRLSPVRNRPLRIAG
jgi:transposase-like protein